MEFLRNLASSGQAILCTIHQPPAELFQVFDRLLLLHKGGQTIYFGNEMSCCRLPDAKYISQVILVPTPTR